jgi:hypothetical protein
MHSVLLRFMQSTTGTSNILLLIFFLFRFLLHIATDKIEYPTDIMMCKRGNKKQNKYK